MKRLLSLLVLLIFTLSCEGESVKKDDSKKKSVTKVSTSGLIHKKSNYSVKVTLKRLKTVLKKAKKKGLRIALIWSHSKRAMKSKSKINIRPTILVIFGNPNLGSHFFTSRQTSGIDLPMKALVWKDKEGRVWLTYNNPRYLAARHDIKNREKQVSMMFKALNKITSFATGAPPAFDLSKALQKEMGGGVIVKDGSYDKFHKAGLISKRSKNSVKVTLRRLKQVLKKAKKKGLRIALIWSHSKRARRSKSRIMLRPTELVIFGNPNLGSHFFTSNQTSGIDLPMKALVWKDKKGRVWLTYNDPQFIANRHEIMDRDKQIKMMRNALNKITNYAVTKGR